MNKVQKSAVSNLHRNSEEYSVVQSICQNEFEENSNSSVIGVLSNFRELLLNVCSLNSF